MLPLTGSPPPAVSPQPPYFHSAFNTINTKEPLYQTKTHSLRHSSASPVNPHLYGCKASLSSCLHIFTAIWKSTWTAFGLSINKIIIKKCCIHSEYLWMMLKYVWWFQLFKCDKYLQKINQEGDKYILAAALSVLRLFCLHVEVQVVPRCEYNGPITRPWR